MSVPEIVRLRDENEALRARIAQLEQMFTGVACPSDWRLSKDEDRLVAALYGCRDAAPWDYLIEALWGRFNRDEPDDPVGVIRIHVLRIRRKLGSAAIETRWGYGYRLGVEARSVIDALNARAA